MMHEHTMKVHWSGRIIAVQPRIRLTRSFDERYHSYRGFVLLMDGVCSGSVGEFVVAIGKAAQEKHGFRAGMEASGEAVAVEDPRKESAVCRWK